MSQCMDVCLPGPKKRGSCKEVGISRGSTVEWALYVYFIK